MFKASTDVGKTFGPKINHLTFTEVHSIRMYSPRWHNGQSLFDLNLRSKTIPHDVQMRKSSLIVHGSPDLKLNH